MDYEKATIKQLHEALSEKKVSAVDLLAESKKVIEQKDGEIGAFLEVFDSAMEGAKKADEMIARGEQSYMTGIPIALKDNISIKGENLTCGSKILEGYRAIFDAEAVINLKRKGAVIVGRTNCDEFAMGSTTEHSAYKQTKNPIALDRVPGGSSGGSAAAVAMGAVPMALGSDTGGSVRQPASFCGCVGLKPTYGKVSRYGLVMLSSSLDCIGPLTRSVEDAKIVLDVISENKESYDSVKDIYSERTVKENKKTLGVCWSLVDQADAKTVELFKQTVQELKGKGYKIVDIEFPLAAKSPFIYYIIQPAEASSNLARFDGVRYGAKVEGENVIDDYFKTRGALLGDEAKRRIIVGTYVLSAHYYDAYYGKAIIARQELKNELQEILNGVDGFLTPTTISHALKLGANMEPTQIYAEDVFTVISNLTGTPAISVPMKQNDGALPIGVQIIAGYNSEDVLFSIASDIIGT